MSLIERLDAIDPADTPCMAKELATEASAAISAMRLVIKPLADAVFNDNGDMTVSTPLVTSEQCIAAYFAMKRLNF